MKIKIFGVFILIIFFVSSGFAYQDPKETELLFMAKKAYADGFYEVSLGMLERFQKNYPDSAKIPQAALLSAECYFYQGRYLEALNILQALSKNPQADAFGDELYFWMAQVHFKGDNFQKSAELYEKLIAHFPQSSFIPEAYYSLGWSYSALGKFSQAISAFKTLIEKFPREPQAKDAAFKLIECLYNHKDYAELKIKILPVFKLYSNDALRLPYLYFYLAESEYYSDNFDQAAKNYLACAKAFKDPAVQALAKLGLGWSYLKLAKYKEAQEVLADIKSGSLDKKSLEILILGQAVLESAMNRVYEAKKLYERLINLTTDPLISFQAYLGKADAHYNLAEYPAAIDVYKAALDKIDQTSLPAELMDKLRYNLGLAYLKTGQIDSSVDVFNHIAGKDKTNLLLQIAQAYQDANELLKAQETYAKIIKLYPDASPDGYAQYQLAALQLERLDYASAAASFSLLLKKYPQSKFVPDALYALGTAYFQQANYAKSGEILLKFRDEFKDSPDRLAALYLLARSWMNLGKINEALEILKDVAKSDILDIEFRQKVEYEIADACAKLGQEAEAVSRFKILRAKYPDSKLTAEIMWWLGQYYYRNNDLSLARRYFSSLIQDFSDSALIANAYYALGLTFSQENKFEQAVDNFKLAIKLSAPQESADIRFSLAEALEASAQAQEAIQQYLAAADLYKQARQITRALLRAAKLYEDQENFKEALNIYKRIIQKTPQAPEAAYVQERMDWIENQGDGSRKRTVP